MPPVATTPPDLLRAALAEDPARPLLTHLDGRTGERTEVSVTTFDNWVAKTAGLLVDGLGAAPGARVALRLPPHWQGLVWAAACWAAGCVAVPGGRDGDVVVLGPDEDAAGAPGDEVVVMALRPLAAPGPPAPAGVTDYDREVLGYADRFSSPHGPPPAAGPALELPGGRRLTSDDLVGAAGRAAEQWGLGPRERVLVADPLGGLDGLLAALLAPLASGAAALLALGLDDAALAHAVEQERVTAAFLPAGSAVPAGVRRLPPLQPPA